MKLTTLGLSVAAGLAGLAIGCDESSNTPTPQVETRTTADQAADSAKSTAEKVGDKAREVGNATADAAGDLKDNLKDAAADAKDKLGDLKDNATTTANTNTASDAGAGVVAQAQKLYDDAVNAVNKADFSTAEKYFEQLKSLRDKLPADWQAKVDQLGQLIADGKAKLGNLPNLPR